MGVKSEHFMSQVQQLATGTSVSAAGVSWLAAANEVLQLVATIIAIVAGVIALYPTVKKWLIQRRSS